MIVLSVEQLRQICADMAELGANKIKQYVDPRKDFISQTEAYKEFEQTRVERWVDKGFVSKRRSGAAKNSKIKYSYTELLEADKAERFSYIMITNKLEKYEIKDGKGATYR